MKQPSEESLKIAREIIKINPKDKDDEYLTFCSSSICKKVALALDQAKKPLEETIKFVESQVAKVYMHITGGKLSKYNYYAEGVISEADDYYEKLYQEDIEELQQQLSERDKRIKELEERLKQC